MTISRGTFRGAPSVPDQPVRPERPRRLRLVVAAVAAAAFVALTVLALAGATARLDQRLMDWFRPDDEWGDIQQTLLPIIDALEPRRTFLLLGVVALAVSVRRWSLRPAIYLGVVGGAAAVGTMLAKFAVRSADPRGEMSATGGSYPSGHMVGVIVCLGCCALVLWQTTRWWHWVAIAGVAVAMGAALLFTAAHWPSDVLGGALLGVAVLGFAAALPLRSSVFTSRAGTHGRWGRRTSQTPPAARSGTGPMGNDTDGGRNMMLGDRRSNEDRHARGAAR
jgi:membrane-associated phospholipid phosphatase